MNGHARPGPPAVADRRPALDRLFPRWDFDERHRIGIAGQAPDRVLAAVEATTWSDLPTFRAIVLALGAAHTRPRPDARVFADFLGTGPALARTGDEVVYGWIVRVGRRGRGAARVDAPAEAFAAYAPPGTLKIGFNFRYADDVLTTETRVCATDARTRRVFRPYWLLVKLPGGLIRREWLRRIRRRVLRSATDAEERRWNR